MDDALVIGDTAMRSTHRERATRVLKRCGTLTAACTAGPTPTLPLPRTGVGLDTSHATAIIGRVIDGPGDAQPCPSSAIRSTFQLQYLCIETLQSGRGRERVSSGGGAVRRVVGSWANGGPPPKRVQRRWKTSVRECRECRECRRARVCHAPGPGIVGQVRTVDRAGCDGACM